MIKLPRKSNNHRKIPQATFLRYDELIKFPFGLRQIVTPVQAFMLPFFRIFSSST